MPDCLWCEPVLMYTGKEMNEHRIATIAEVEMDYFPSRRTSVLNADRKCGADNNQPHGANGGIDKAAAMR